MNGTCGLDPHLLNMHNHGRNLVGEGGMSPPPIFYPRGTKLCFFPPLFYPKIIIFNRPLHACCMIRESLGKNRRAMLIFVSPGLKFANRPPHFPHKIVPMSWIPWNLSFRYMLFHEKDSKRCNDTTTPESIHTKDESKRGSAFAFIFGVNWPVYNECNGMTSFMEFM